MVANRVGQPVTTAQRALAEAAADVWCNSSLALISGISERTGAAVTRMIRNIKTIWRNIMSDISPYRRPSFKGVGAIKNFIPIGIYPFLHEIWVTPAQFEIAVIWLDHGDPDRPRKLKTVLSRKAQRTLARKLIEKGILVKNGSGYVLAPECRKHIAHYRDQEA